MATTTVLPAPVNNAPTFLSVIGVFTVIAISLCVARTYTRIRSKDSLRIDDYLILIGTILCTAFYCTTIVGTAHGWGQHSAYVSPGNQVIAMKSLFSAMTIWIMACALVRLSIAVSLLRLSTERIWRGGLWTIITAQIVLYIVFMVFQLFSCRPLRSSWEPVYDVRCWPRHHVRDFGYVSSGFLTAIDFTLALMPIHLIRRLNRRTREKILICFMMSLGLMAGVISSYKISISDKTFRGDLLSGTVILAMWNELEALLGIVAACVPCLKAPGERLLHRVGLLATRGEMTRPSFVISLQDQISHHTSNGSDPLHSLPSSGGSGKGSDLDKRNVVTVEVDRSVP